jgi:hypothetical protein
MRNYQREHLENYPCEMFHKKWGCPKSKMSDRTLHRRTIYGEMHVRSDIDGSALCIFSKCKNLSTKNICVFCKDKVGYICK